jgi:trehalose synthase
MAELIMQACPERGTTVEAYAPIIGQAQLDDFKRLGEALSDLRIQHVNSTAAGGGVAELLNRIVPMMNELGVETRWDVINGTDRFYEITKAFHNGLHGRPVQLSAKIFSDFRECSRAFAHEFQVQGNAVLIHDPQPIGLIRKRPTRGDVWAWRCHVDVSQPNATIWRFLEKFITRYDACVFSAAHFSKRVPVRQFLIAPSIDPLAEKNRDLTDADVDHVFERLQIPRDLPIVTQVSRFDYLKDPVGVVRMFRAVKKYAKCRLVLAGGGAADDPEGAQVLAETREAAGTDPLIHRLNHLAPEVTA